MVIQRLIQLAMRSEGKAFLGGRERESRVGVMGEPRVGVGCGENVAVAGAQAVCLGIKGSVSPCGSKESQTPLYLDHRDEAAERGCALLVGHSHLGWGRRGG